MFRRIVVPLDHSSLAERQLAYAAGFARRFDAPLTLLRAYNWSERLAMADAPPLEIIVDSQPKEEADARHLLEEHAAPLREQGLQVDTVVVDSGAPEAIAAEAAREPGTLVVIGNHERGWLSRLVRGGTLHEVLQHFNTPALIVR